MAHGATVGPGDIRREDAEQGIDIVH
jgi:hypothetical protein